MKKKVQKSLRLNKMTISNLNHKEKQQVLGGTTLGELTCYCNTDHKSCSLQINCCPPPEKAVLFKEFDEK